MNFVAWCLAAVLAVALVWQAAAGEKAETVEEMLNRRIAWIEEHFPDLKHDGETLPRVEIVPNEVLLGMTGRGPDADVSAVYDRGVNIIWLRDDFDPFGLEASHVIIHELVHFLQQVREPRPVKACAADLEPEAYKVQEQWQREFGPWPPRWNWLFIIVISECRGDR